MPRNSRRANSIRGGGRHARGRGASFERLEGRALLSAASSNQFAVDSLLARGPRTASAYAGFSIAPDSAPSVSPLQVVEFDLRTRTQKRYSLPESLAMMQGIERPDTAATEGSPGLGLPPALPMGPRPASAGVSEAARPPGFIFAPDGRSRVASDDVGKYPWSANGRTWGVFGSNEYAASGTMINKSWVLTSGAAVYDFTGKTGWASQVTFSPGQDGPPIDFQRSEYQPFGQANATRLYAPNGWTQSGDRNFDIGWFQLDRNVGLWTGTFGYGSNTDDAYYDATFSNVGYPSDASPGMSQYLQSGNPRSYGITADQLKSNTLDMVSGQGGSSLFIQTSGGRRIGGVLSAQYVFKDSGQPAFNAATRITRAKFDAITNTINNAQSPTDYPDLVDYDSWYNASEAECDKQQVIVGDTLNVRAYFGNIGTASTRSFIVRYRLSTDETYDPEDIFVGDGVAFYGELLPFYFVLSGSVTQLRIPEGTPEGTYHLVWRIDPENKVDEFSTANNFGLLKKSQITVGPPSGEIRGTVWNDANANRKQDPGESGLANWTVFIDQNSNGLPDSGEPTQLTDNAGSYAFTGLRAGNYVVGQVVPSGWMQTSPNVTTWTAQAVAPASSVRARVADPPNIREAGFAPSQAARRSQLVSLPLPKQYDVKNLGGYLTEPSADDALAVVKAYMSANAGRLGVSPADILTMAVTDRYTDADTGVTHIYLRQRLNGLDVRNATFAAHVDGEGRLVSISGGFASGIAPLAVQASRLSASAVLSRVASQLGLAASDVTRQTVASLDDAARGMVLAAASLSLDPIPANLEYVPTADGGLALGWRFILRTPDGDHWYDVTADAASGNVLAQSDWVDHASYTVFPLPVETPDDGSRAVLTDPHDVRASPFGWHDTNGVAGGEFTDTRGNNVYAQEDVANNNSNAGFRPDGGSSLAFSFPLDLTTSPDKYQSAAITNLFYVNNVCHDVFSAYGFTEAAGNFQMKNYSGQGLGGDAVMADAQDGSGVNNANFATPPDGRSPRMQMYVFDSSTPRRDGDLDNQIIIHEYGHGVSNRLVGGPSNASALDALQSGGMGEGWSDFFGLMFTQKAADSKTGSYTLGTYVVGEPTTGAGIRRYPYSFNMTVNPLTYRDIRSNSEVHDQGEVWCSALWDMNWLLIDRYGFSPAIAAGYSSGSAGNILALKLVVDALKLTPANPTFLQARDAILQADQVLTRGSNHDIIWTAFARRGMGFSALDGGNANSVLVTESFDIPKPLPPGMQRAMLATSRTTITAVDFGNKIKVAVPEVASVTPRMGPLAGGTRVVIDGINFNGLQSVWFGPKKATILSRSATQITVRSPKSDAGAVHISVVTTLGDSSLADRDLFTFVARPIVSQISPNTGPKAGGTTVTIVGTDLGNASAVMFGSKPATSFTIVSATTIRAVAPAGKAGAVNVVVTTPGGKSGAGKAARFTFSRQVAAQSGLAQPALLVDWRRLTTGGSSMPWFAYAAASSTQELESSSLKSPGSAESGKRVRLGVRGS